MLQQSFCVSLFQDRDKGIVGMKFRMLLLLTLFFSTSVVASDWTWSYRKGFSGSELRSLVGKAHVTFSKVSTPEFKQLIFSWNAYRPKQGYFTFYVQSRDAANNRWSPWYKMVEWGSAVQRSHFVSKIGQPDYVYVRLEQPKGSFANGFRLKVEAHGKASLSKLRALGVSISDFNKFKIEPVGRYKNYESIFIKGVPKQSQMSIKHEDFPKMCSPTATGMLVGYLNGKKVNALKFAKQVYDNGLGVYGSWPFNVSHAFEVCPSRHFRATRLKNFDSLYKYLDKKIPVVVSVRGQLNGAPKEYKNGHLIIVIGWDKKKQGVICHDPAVKGSRNVKRTYSLSKFLRSWENSRRLAYVVD